jgi:RimJ/RimL family protein N-acetyltransferase
MELTRTGRLLLRHWEEDDLPAFFDLYSRDEVMRWLGPQPRRALASPDEARAGLRRWHAREQGLDLPMGFWAIVPLGRLGRPGRRRRSGPSRCCRWPMLTGRPA